MELISIGAAQKLTSPNPFGLVTARKPDGSTNVMALSWWTYVSNHPATLAVCLSNKGYTGSCIAADGAFGLSIVGSALKDAALKAGTCSGRDRDKAAELGSPLMQLDGFGPQLVEGSRLCFACALKASYPMEDHTLYVGRIDQIWADPSVEGLYAFQGYGALDTI